MTWVQIFHPDIITSEGYSRQIGFRGQREFIYLLRRVGVADDNIIPRVVVGVGASQGDAMTQALEEVRTYDSASHVVWAHDEAHPAHKAR